ncbi:MAG: hypothetical protein KGD57_00510 [Candidatus Lokiarchaeota archaeon]|nr:hypothetical protein [Candidatus Lokiarchaeota archaeon]
MYDIIIIGAGISGASFANKISKYAKSLLIEVKKDINIKTNIFPEHNNPYITNINFDDKEIFPCEHTKTNYLGKNINGIINSEEFGASLGKIVHTEILINKLITNFIDNGGTVKFDEEVKKINRGVNKVEIITTKNTYYSKLLVLATGSRNFELQKSLGFDIPDSYSGIYTHLSGSEDIIKENFDFNYLFHLNPNISKNGPFFFNIGKGRVSTGFLGNPDESRNELKSKLKRILENYNLIQPYLKDLKWDQSTFIISKISKHPIKNFSQDRVLILGEAAGLVTAFFYEGFLSGLLSAEIASETIMELVRRESNFSKMELNTYDQELNRILLKNYYKNGLACEYLFYNPNPKVMNIIWDSYTKLISENKRLRKEIWEAYRLHDITDYDTNRDKWAGEQLFKKLPTISKITLGPKFIRALMKF